MKKTILILLFSLTLYGNTETYHVIKCNKPNQPKYNKALTVNMLLLYQGKTILYNDCIIRNMLLLILDNQKRMNNGR